MSSEFTTFKSGICKYLLKCVPIYLLTDLIHLVNLLIFCHLITS